MSQQSTSPRPTHHRGTTGAGRPTKTTTPRFSTGINPNDRKPIDPKSPYLPPA